jgi:hypothetical protein
LKLNYTTYDVRRAQDTINPNGSNSNIILPASAQPNLTFFQSGSDPTTLYAYARVLGIYHANVICVGKGPIDSTPQRIDFLWVRWYEYLPASGPFRLEKVQFPLLSDPGATSFVDPSIVIRGCHIVPNFSRGMRYPECDPKERGSSIIARDRDDWREYYINQ